MTKALEEMRGDEESRRREADFLRFEIDEIEQAAVKEGEEEELTAQYRRFSNGRKILESLGAAYEAVETEGLGRAMHRSGGQGNGLSSGIRRGPLPVSRISCTMRRQSIKDRGGSHQRLHGGAVF